MGEPALPCSSMRADPTRVSPVGEEIGALGSGVRAMRRGRAVAHREGAGTCQPVRQPSAYRRRPRGAANGRSSAFRLSNVPPKSWSMYRFRPSHLCLLAPALLGLDTDAGAAVVNDARVTNVAAGPQVRSNPLLPWRSVGASGKIPEVVQARCEKPCTIKANDDVSIELEPGSVVMLRDHFFVPVVPNAPMTRARQVELVKGHITAVSSGRPGAMPVVVQHELAYVAVQSGRVEIALRGDDVLVSSSETQARVAVRRGWSTVEPNHTILLTREGPAAPKAKLAQPLWDVEDSRCVQALAFVKPSEKGGIGGCWKPIDRARAYQVEIAKDPDFTDIEQVVETTEPSWSAERDPGRWFARVRAVDAEGFRSDVSESRAMGVAPVRMPDGSLLDASHRTLIVPDGCQVEFLDPAGLQVAIDRGTFIALPAVFRLAGDSERKLRIRYQGERHDSSVFSVQKRQLRAAIELSPRVASWPTDPIDILVRVEDPSGLWNLNSLEPKFQVLVGMTETKVDWSRSGATWAARLPPRDLAGPTVVRVIARDQFGLQLGRNFLEVDYGRRALASSGPVL